MVFVKDVRQKKSLKKLDNKRGFLRGKMKKSELKRKLRIATTALELYRGYMINGKLYAAEALNDMDKIDNEKFYLTDELRKKIVNEIYDTMQREFKL